MATERPTPLRRGVVGSRVKAIPPWFQWPRNGQHLCDVGVRFPGGLPVVRRFNGHGTANTSATRLPSSDAEQVAFSLLVSMATERPTPLRPTWGRSSTRSRPHVSMATERPTPLRLAGYKGYKYAKIEVSMATERPTPLRQACNGLWIPRRRRFNGHGTANTSATRRHHRRAGRVRRVSMATERPTPLRRPPWPNSTRSRPRSTRVSMATERPTPLRLPSVSAKNKQVPFVSMATERPTPLRLPHLRRSAARTTKASVSMATERPTPLRHPGYQEWKAALVASFNGHGTANTSATRGSGRSARTGSP